MKGSEILRIVDAIHRDKNVDKEIVFEGIEQAILSAAKKHFGEEEEITVAIDRQSGDASVLVKGEPLRADEIGDLLGRIAAQTAKQVMIQKIREAERDSLFDEYTSLRGQIVTGQISRVEGGGTGLVNLGKVEGILPRGEQIPGEAHHVGERVRAVVMDVRKAGSRVKIILSRTHPEFVRRLFELEIPEVSEHIIEVRSLAREAGYRSKVAVSCYDTKIDCVGACVGVRGSRIRSVVDELAGERIDIVRWNDSLQVLVPNALQPAEVEDVILCPQLGKVIVLVREDQLSLAIGKKGQNVRLASKLVGWDIQVLTQERLDEQIDRSLTAFSKISGITSDLAEGLVAQGFFTFDELSVIEPDQLAELGGLTDEQCDEIIAAADEFALQAEQQDKLERERRRAAAELGVSAPAATTATATAVAEEDADNAEADLEEDADAEKPTESLSAETEERHERERQAEGSGGPHDETEIGGDPDGGDVVEHMLATGASIDPSADGEYVTLDADTGPETEVTPEGLTETSAAGDEAR
jgi:N utilization substance protein A